MQLGISTYSLPWAVGVAGFKPQQPLRAMQVLDFAVQNDIRYVQFGDNYPLHELAQVELAALKRTADQMNIRIQVGTMGLTIPNINKYLAIAAFMGSPFIRMVIDADGYTPTVEEVQEVIKYFLPQLQQLDVKLAIENHDRFPVQIIKQIIEGTDPERIGICLDTANSLGAGEGINEVVSCLAPYTINLHIKDYTIKRAAHKMGFKISGCAAGRGMLNVPWLVNEVRAYGRCDTATLEVWCDPEQTIEESIVKERELAENSIQYLKTIIT